MESRTQELYEILQENADEEWSVSGSTPIAHEFGNGSEMLRVVYIIDKDKWKFLYDVGESTESALSPIETGSLEGEWRSFVREEL